MNKQLLAETLASDPDVFAPYTNVYQVRFTFINELLGAVPLNKEIYTDYVLSRAPTSEDTSDELDALQRLEKGTTGFLRTADGKPALMNNTIKGWMKESCGILRRVAGSKSKGITAYKTVIGGLTTIKPRFIPIITDEPLSILERPLRAQNAQGEVMTLARSEMVQAGAHIEFFLCVRGEILNEELLKEWFEYAGDHGIGQWRGAEYGAAEVTYIKVK